jgi:hypothetical protein
MRKQIIEPLGLPFAKIVIAVAKYRKPTFNFLNWNSQLPKNIGKNKEKKVRN